MRAGAIEQRYTYIIDGGRERASAVELSKCLGPGFDRTTVTPKSLCCAGVVLRLSLSLHQQSKPRPFPLGPSVCTTIYHPSI